MVPYCSLMAIWTCVNASFFYHRHIYLTNPQTQIIHTSFNTAQAHLPSSSVNEYWFSPPLNLWTALRCCLVDSGGCLEKGMWLCHVKYGLEMVACSSDLCFIYFTFHSRKCKHPMENTAGALYRFPSSRRDSAGIPLNWHLWWTSTVLFKVYQL